MMDEKGINIQYIKEYRPSTTVQYEQIHYNEIQRMERIQMTLQVRKMGNEIFIQTSNFHSFADGRR